MPINLSKPSSGNQIISDGTISISDVTTNNATTSQHGFLKKLSGNVNEFLNGIGDFSIPAGGGGSSDKTILSNKQFIEDDGVINQAILMVAEQSFGPGNYLTITDGDTSETYTILDSPVNPFDVQRGTASETYDALVVSINTNSTLWNAAIITAIGPFTKYLIIYRQYQTLDSYDDRIYGSFLNAMSYTNYNGKSDYSVDVYETIPEEDLAIKTFGYGISTDSVYPPAGTKVVSREDDKLYIFDEKTYNWKSNSLPILPGDPTLFLDGNGVFNALPVSGDVTSTADPDETGSGLRILGDTVYGNKYEMMAIGGLIQNKEGNYPNGTLLVLSDPGGVLFTNQKWTELMPGAEKEVLQITSGLPTWADGKSISETLPSDVTAEGLNSTHTVGENFAFGDIGYYKSDGKVWKADANGSATFPGVVMALGTITTGNAGSFLRIGSARKDAWTWTIGGLIYLDTTAGGMTQTAPSATNDVVQVLGIAFPNADTIQFNPQLYYFTHA